MEILLFGIAKDIVGSSSYRFNDKEPKPLTVKELKGKMQQAFPELGKLSSLAVAVNSEYAEDHTSVVSGDEIALIPPVSGG